METLLSVDKLTIETRKDNLILVENVSFKVSKGEILGIVGESGSGKSLSCLSILGLLAKSLQLSSGSILFTSKSGSVHELNGLKENQFREIRASEISMIFQEPLTALNPVLTCKNQLFESLKLAGVQKKDYKKRAKELLDEVDLKDTDRVLMSYPFELSGGQRQRVMIAMALACNPSLLIADEPTTALDVLVTKDIIDLLQKLCSDREMAMIFVSHDMELVQSISQKLLVMYKGKIMDYGVCSDVVNNPTSAYTKALMNCSPSLEDRGQTLPSISEMLTEGENELEYKVPVRSKLTEKELSNENILSVSNLNKRYADKSNKGKYFIALDAVSIEVKKGESLGIVGASGSGKSTLAKSLVNLETPDEGAIEFADKGKRSDARFIQLVFQDPFSSLNPIKTIRDLLLEPMAQNATHKTKADREDKAIEYLEAVGLNRTDLKKYPHEFSGGQRQRINVARALCLEPEIIVLDESVSALDVSVQAQVLNLLNEIQRKFTLTFVFITHDLEVAGYFCDRIAVMNEGRVVELGDAEDLFKNPQTDYARTLLNARKHS
jgi:peptide/nickel transport system ATP-binding protein